MLIPKIAFLITIAFSWLLVNEPKVSAAKVGKKLASEFCSHRSTLDDRNFCLQVLTSDPKSASAKDHPALLKIAVNAANGNAERTLDYLKTEFKSKVTNPNLKPILKDCITMYGTVINEFKGVLDNLDKDSALVKLYARVANDEIKGCENIVKSKGIEGTSISNRNKIAGKYGVLVEDIARLV